MAKKCEHCSKRNMSTAAKIMKVKSNKKKTHNLHVLSPVPTWRMHIKCRSFLSSGHGRKRTAVYNRPSCRPCVKCKKKTNAIQVVPRHISGWSSVTSTAGSCAICWGDVLPMPSLLHSTALKAVHFCGGWRRATYTEKKIEVWLKNKSFFLTRSEH